MGLRSTVGARHTEFGGGPGEPQRKPDGQAQVLDAAEAARAVRAAAWDEVRGDAGTGRGRNGGRNPVLDGRGSGQDSSMTANGYAANAQRGEYTSVIAP